MKTMPTPEYKITNIVAEEIRRGETSNLYGLAVAVDAEKVADKMLEGVALEAGAWVPFDQLPTKDGLYEVLSHSGRQCFSRFCHGGFCLIRVNKDAAKIELYPSSLMNGIDFIAYRQIVGEQYE